MYAALYGECRAGAQIFPLKVGVAYVHVTPTIFDIRSNISLKLLELETSNLVCSFVWAMPSRRTKIFPESGRGLGHVTPYNRSTVGYPSDSLASCTNFPENQLTIVYAFLMCFVVKHCLAERLRILVDNCLL